jgi:hypothetical protein
MRCFQLRDFHPLRLTFPDPSFSCAASLFASPTTPACAGLGFSAFARHYSQNPFLSSGYLDVSVPPVPHPNLCVQLGLHGHAPMRVSPFGHLRFKRLHTPHRSFSQCTTSFIGTRCLGIPRTPLLTSFTFIFSRSLIRRN